MKETGLLLYLVEDSCHSYLLDIYELDYLRNSQGNLKRNWRVVGYDIKDPTTDLGAWTWREPSATLLGNVVKNNILPRIGSG